MEFFTDEFLFAIDDANLQSDLDNNNIPEEFRQGFEKTIFYALRGSDLDSATVVTEKKGSKWLIVDERKDKLRFPIRKEEGRLKVYARSTESDTFRNAWYSRNLFALREPLLFNKKEDKEIYRFTWLRSFHNPIAIRIEKANEKYRIVWKVCNGSGGYSPGILVESKQREITEQDWGKFIELLKETDFWNMPTRIHKVALDGSQWILEGTDDSRYYVVDRFAPRDDDYYRCCDYLISLTDLRIADKEKY